MKGTTKIRTFLPVEEGKGAGNVELARSRLRRILTTHTNK